MEVAYSLSLLFNESEFDVVKGCNRYGSKEAFFSVLRRFTLDIDRLLQKCKEKPKEYTETEIENLERWTDRLVGLLASIGAISLAWKVQSIKKTLNAKRVSEFLEKFDEILLESENLSNRIKKAEKTADSVEKKEAQVKEDTAEAVPDEQKLKVMLHHNEFEKLYMLIDNFELDSAARTAVTIMKDRFCPDIDRALAGVYKSLVDFDYNESFTKARSLLSTVNSIKEDESCEKKTILAIDDLPGVLTTVEAMLKGKYKVYCMTDYFAAAKFLTSNTIDLILLDIEMPGIDGFAMIQLFRSIPEYAETPIIFLTSHGTDEHIKTAMRLGARDFIRKPVDLGVLLKKLENAFSS